jgi:Tetratricopeptide repeat
VDPGPDTVTSVRPDVRLAPTVITALQRLPRRQQAAVAGALTRIGNEAGTPLQLGPAGEGRQYLTMVPDGDAEAPVVVYRQLEDREGGGYLVTGLSDRDAFSAYERPRPAVFAGGGAAGKLAYQRPTTAIQPVRLAPRPTLLIGREGLFAELEERLAAGNGSAPRIVALCGLGGAGKSSVAVEYAYRHLAEMGMAWEFPVEDPAVMAAGFGELAVELGIGNLAESRDPVAAVHAVLARYPSPWLLIFDNAPDMASVAPYLPPAGPGKILITSPNPSWPGESLEVPVLDSAAAATFLMTRTGDQDREAAAELTAELGGLPLALAQAAAYIAATGQSLASYLTLFRQRRLELLSRGEPTGYGKTVATTWELAFKRVQQTSPSAAGLLRLLAFYAPDAVPLRLLLQVRPGIVPRLGHEVTPVLASLLGDPLAAEDAVAALRRYSLVTPAADGSVSVHRLVQTVTRGDMTRELTEAWHQAAVALIEAAIPADPRDPSNWPVFGSLLPHAKAALAPGDRGTELMAEYLGYRGNYVAAKDLQRSVFEARERQFGPEDTRTLAARRGVARWTGEAGDAVVARNQYAALLPVTERVLGPYDPDTLVTRRGLAYWTGEAGDAAAARDQYAALLPVMERVLGTENPDTLIARRDLAYWTGEAGDAAAARDQYAALLPVMERILGPENPDTLETRNYLARSTGRAGDAVGARDQYAALLPIKERTLGPDHPDTLIARRGIARWTGEAGDPAGARDQYAALLPAMERVLGPEHPSTLITRDFLARWTGEAGDAAAARDQYQELVPVMSRVLGPDHPATLAARAGLARWTGEAGDAATARDEDQELLPVMERVCGERHPSTVAVRDDLTHWTARAAGRS